MTIVDTAVGIDFFRGRRAVAALRDLLRDDEVQLHPWTLGELLLGALGRRRSRVAADLTLLPRATVIGDDDLYGFIAARRLAGKGIGWVDTQLLASAVASGSRLWTTDRRLHEVAVALGAAKGDVAR
jgi:predicted nucleic acid-binding protein